MRSVLAWLDHNEDDRRRMREIIDLFREQDTRDELGVGAVRDAFSEELFPGTSTIQTRPRYFLLVPWVYLELERRKVPSAQVTWKARELEVHLIYSLLAGGEHRGVLGRDAKEHLIRLPSTVYWGGLGSYRIRLFRGSIDDYNRSLDSYHQRIRTGLRAESEELYERASPNWHPGLPEPPAGLFEAATLALRWSEADYLRERITATHPESMLALTLRGPRLTRQMAYPWDYPHRLPNEILTTLRHAQAFSEVMHGAALLYNLLLARKGREDRMGDQYQPLVERYEERMQDWSELLHSRSDQLGSWDRNHMWAIVYRQNPRVTPRTRAFINEWIRLATDRPEGVARHSGATNLIRHREFQLKGNLARLQNTQQLEMWGGAAGTGRLDYRWPTARTLVRDVQKGLTGAGD